MCSSTFCTKYNTIIHKFEKHTKSSNKELIIAKNCNIRYSGLATLVAKPAVGELISENFPIPKYQLGRKCSQEYRIFIFLKFIQVSLYFSVLVTNKNHRFPRLAMCITVAIIEVCDINYL